MPIDFVMPDLGLVRGTAVLGQWLVDVGSAVPAGESLVEIVAEGVTIELASPVDAVLAAIHVGEDDVLVPGARMAVLATDEGASIPSD